MIFTKTMWAADCDKCEAPLLDFSDRWAWGSLSDLKEVAEINDWQVNEDATCLCEKCKSEQND